MSNTYTKNVYSCTATTNKCRELIKILKPYLENDPNIDQKAVYKYNDTTITIYPTHKVVIQGENVVKVVSKFKLPYVEYQKNTKNNSPKYEYSSYIGCDEVGVGDYFGGIVCAAVYVDESIILKLRNLSVQDSKKLSDDQIKKLATKIMKICTYNVEAFTPAQFNDYYQSYPNMNTIKTICHNTNIVQLQRERIAKKKDRAIVIMDQYCSEEMYLKHLQSLHHKIVPTLQRVDVFETKAESKYIGVAAASVLARYFFLKQIDDLIKFINKQTGLKLTSLPLGATNKTEIQKTIRLIQQHTKDPNILTTIIKTNFKKI